MSIQTHRVFRKTYFNSFGQNRKTTLEQKNLQIIMVTAAMSTRGTTHFVTMEFIPLLFKSY